MGLEKDPTEQLQDHDNGDAALNTKITRGVGWSGASTMLVGLLGLLTNLVLARLLEPESFGIIFMAMVFTGLFQVAGEMGLSAALIQRRESEIKTIHYHTAFWSGVLLGISFYVLAYFLIAPLAAWFFDEPVLVTVIRVMGISLLIRPLFVTHRAVLSREMDFKSVSMAESISMALACTLTLLLAWFGWGVWSLALQNVWMALFALPVFLWLTRYTPAFRFGKAAFRDIFLFSLTVTGNKIIGYATQNLDNLLVGRFVGSQALGIYGLIYLITHTFRAYMMGIMNKVMYPVYGKLQDNTASMKHYYLAVIKYNTLGLFPVMTILILLAEPLLTIGFGTEWSDGAFPLQMLALSVMVQAVGGTSASLLHGMGRPGLNLRIALSRTLVITLPTLSAGIYYYGIDGAAVAILISKGASRLIYQYYLRRFIGVSEADILKSIMPALIPFVVMLVTGKLLLTWIMIEDMYTLIPAIIVSLLILLACTAITARSEILTLRRFFLPGKKANK